MIPPISPTVQAEEARAKAARLDGKERAYWLWLASEWDKRSPRQPPLGQNEAGRGARELRSEPWAKPSD